MWLCTEELLAITGITAVSGGGAACNILLNNKACTDTIEAT
jgi:hypothetical protein